METPYIDHLSVKDYEHVYEPAQDTFLLLDALEADLAYIDKIQPLVCVEVGSGSGVIITALAKHLKNKAICLATDINELACLATRSTAKRNIIDSVECIQCNLVDSLQSHSVDLLVFNPPYVVTTDEEMQMQKFGNIANNANQLVSAWAGGKDGICITNLLLDRLDEILSVKGVLYLLLLHENKPKEIIQKLVSVNFNAKMFMERRIPGELLCVLKVTRCVDNI